MACGVHLGVLLMCLVQAEHVYCLWAAQAQRLNTYVGFSHPDSGFGGSYPQNELRQASVSPGSAQSGGFNTDTAVSGVYSRGLSSSGSTRTVSQPDISGFASVRLVPSSSASEPTNWLKLNKVNQQKIPQKQSFDLSTSIASGGSVSKYDKKPLKQSTQRTSSSSASLQSPYYQSTAQKAPAAAQTSANYGQTRYSPSMSSSLFGAGAPLPDRIPPQTRTSASVPARRVSPGRSSVASKPSSFSSLQNERPGNHPEAGKPYTSRLFPVNAGNVHGSYRPTSTSHMTSSHVGHSDSLPVSNGAPGGFQPSRQMSASYTSMEEIPSSTGSLQASWNRNPAQGDHNLPASGSSGAGTSDLRFAPTRTHNIPQRYGGHAIRRLGVSDQNEVPQQAHVAPQRPVTQQAHVAPQRPATQQAHVAPQRPATQQAHVAPQRPATQQAHVAPQRPATQQAHVAPQRPATQQAHVAPQRPATQQAHVAPHRSQAQGVQPETKWKRIRLRPAQ